MVSFSTVTGQVLISLAHISEGSRQEQFQIVMQQKLHIRNVILILLLNINRDEC